MPRLSNTYGAELAGAGDVMRVNASDYRTAVERAYARYGRPRIARVAFLSHYARPGCSPYIRPVGVALADDGYGSELAPLGDDWMTGGFTPRNDYPQMDGGA